jgi:hypothetical protein
MCFGDTTSTKTSTSTANPAVASAATSNLQFAQGVRDKGFQGYTGQQVAGFAPQQQSSFDMTNNIANNGTAPRADNLIGSYADAPAQNVQANAIYSQMSPYMNKYVMQALAPQLHQQDVNFAKTRAATDAQATGSGAFGDARTGIEQSNNNFNDNIAREGLIGNAYNSAFNTAIGAGAQDVSNKLSADNANAGYAETALNRSLGGASALQGLQNQQLGVAGAQNTAGAQQTAKTQANLTAQYNQWLMAQQYPFQTAGLVNQTTAAGANALQPTKTETDTSPDNSGFALLGAGLGAAAKFSDIRMKEDIDVVGALLDGTPVFSYRYKDDPARRKEIGLMAQDVKRRRPDAVLTLDDPHGTMMVDYGKATERSRLMSLSI